MFLFNCFAYCMTFQLRPPEIKKDQTKSKPSHWYTFFFLRSYKCVLAGTHLTDFHWIYFSFVLTFFLSSISFRTFKFLCAFFFSQFILLSLWACFFLLFRHIHWGFCFLSERIFALDIGHVNSKPVYRSYYAWHTLSIYNNKIYCVSINMRNQQEANDC